MGHSGECGVPIWGHFSTIGETLTCFVGVFLVAIFLFYFLTTFLNLFHNNTILKCMFGCFCSTIMKCKWYFKNLEFYIRLRNYNWGGYMASGGFIDMASGRSREAKKYHRKDVELEWNVYDDHTQKPGHIWRGYHSRGQWRLQCSMWGSLTLISCSQDLVTRYIAWSSVRIITGLKMWR